MSVVEDAPPSPPVVAGSTGGRGRGRGRGRGGDGNLPACQSWLLSVSALLTVVGFVAAAGVDGGPRDALLVLGFVSLLVLCSTCSLVLAMDARHDCRRLLQARRGAAGYSMTDAHRIDATNTPVICQQEEMSICNNTTPPVTNSGPTVGTASTGQ